MKDENEHKDDDYQHGSGSGYEDPIFIVKSRNNTVVNTYFLCCTLL